MSRDELEKIHDDLVQLERDREALGDFDTNAPAIRYLMRAMLAITKHLLLKHRM